MRFLESSELGAEQNARQENGQQKCEIYTGRVRTNFAFVLAFS